MKVLVTGASGVLGGEVLIAARSSGIAVRAMSRHATSTRAKGEEWLQADLVTGRGLDEAVAGTDAIVHAASDSRHPDAVDVEGTKRLLAAATRANVRHLVFVSIVGVDAVPHSYYKRKLAAEGIVAAGTVPFTILRATQFHSFLDGTIASAARVPLVVPLPSGFLVQPVEASEVADRVVRCLSEGPRGRVTDFAGPEVISLTDAAQLWLDARRSSKRIVPVPMPGSTAAAFRAGKATAPNGELGVTSWREWLMHTRDH